MLILQQRYCIQFVFTSGTLFIFRRNEPNNNNNNNNKNNKL